MEGEAGPGQPTGSTEEPAAASNGAGANGSEPSRSLAERLFSTGTRGAQRFADVSGLDQAIESAVEEAIVRAIESEATENAIARVINGPVIEQAVSEAMASEAVEKAIIEALDSEMTERIWDHVLDGPHTQRLIERIAEAPEVRAAIAAQGIGLIGDLGYQVSRVTRVIDFIGERIVRRVLFRSLRETPTARTGFFTRALAIGIDLLIVNGSLAVLGAVISWLSDSIGITSGQEIPSAMLAVGALLWFLTASLYLIVFWSLSGQTIGLRFLDIRMERYGSFRIGRRAAVRRLVGFWLSAAAFGIPFLTVLVRIDRRGFHDRLGDTMVYFIDPAHPEQAHEQAVL
jgi:uncharacterized RDD family membrane protein YckC